MHGQYNNETVTGSLDNRSVLESSEQDQPENTSFFYPEDFIQLSGSWIVDGSSQKLK